jgi:VWFA-related protein
VAASKSRIPCGVALLAALLVPLGAQQQPVFRSRVDIVTVDAAVLDRAGRPIEGLKAEDFRLEVDGKPRRLVSAQYVPYRTSAVEHAATAGTSAISNEHVPTGRVILVAVDQANIRRVEGRSALRAAANFVDALDPADRVAAVAIDDVAPIHFTNDRPHVKRVLEMLTGRAMSMAFEFNLGLSEALAVSTGNRTRLNEVVLRECGQPLWRLEDMQRIASTEGLGRDPCPVRVEQESRAIANNARSLGEQSVDALKRLLRRLDDIEGPKTLVLLSEGLVAEPQMVDMTELSALAQRARVTIYVLQLDVPAVEAADDRVSPTLADDVRARGDGLARLAGAGGGALFQLVGRDPHPFTRILSELSGYYLLAFEPTAGDRDGRVHRISVSAPSAAVVRARPAFQAPPAPVAPLTVEERLVQLLRTRRLSTELPLRLAAHNARGATPDRVSTIVALETDGGDADVTFGIVVIDEQGTVATSATHRTTTGRYAFPAVLPPGRYLLRAAAIEAGGRTGSIERALVAGLGASGSVQTSDLFLAVKSARPGEPLRPVVDRTSAGVVLASIEVYAGRDLAAAGPGITLNVTGAGAASPALTVTLPLRWSASGFWVAMGELKLEGLPAGRYVAAAELPGGGRVERSFFVVQP